MAVTNFRASDFPKGKKTKEDKTLNTEVEKAARTPRGAARTAKASTKKVDAGEQTKATPKTRSPKPTE